MTPKEQGAASFKRGAHFEMNPYLNNPDRASRCLVATWPRNAAQWHEGWCEEATASAEEAARNRPQMPLNLTADGLPPFTPAQLAFYQGLK